MSISKVVTWLHCIRSSALLCPYQPGSLCNCRLHHTNKIPTADTLATWPMCLTQFKQKKRAQTCIALLGNVHGITIHNCYKGANSCLLQQPAAHWQLVHFKKAICVLQRAQILVRTNMQVKSNVHVKFKNMWLLQQQCNTPLAVPGLLACYQKYISSLQQHH